MVKYDNVSFIKISNNNNASTDYTIDITTMADSRLRISALKSQYKQYKLTGVRYKPIFYYFELDYSFYCVDKDSFDTYDDAKIRREQLMISEWCRMNPNDQRKYEDYF